MASNVPLSKLSQPHLPRSREQVRARIRQMGAAVERRFNLLGTATLPEELGWGNGDGGDDSAAAGPADSAGLAPLTQTYIERSFP